MNANSEDAVTAVGANDPNGLGEVQALRHRLLLEAEVGKSALAVELSVLVSAGLAAPF
jgi:hypothetical protein